MRFLLSGSRQNKAYKKLRSTLKREQLVYRRGVDSIYRDLTQSIDALEKEGGDNQAVLAALRDYEVFIRNSIGLRAQDRLTKEQGE